MTAPDLDLAMETARRAAEAGGAAALRHFRAGVRVELKPDRTPVTVADREAEAAIVEVIRGRFPGHAILGEETGAHAGAGARWIVDPVDGTRGFTRGGSFWGPLVALEVGGEVVAGAMGMPALGELYWAARGRGRLAAGGGRGPRAAARLGHRRLGGGHPLARGAEVPPRPGAAGPGQPADGDARPRPAATATWPAAPWC